MDPLTRWDACHRRPSSLTGIFLALALAATAGLHAQSAQTAPAAPAASSQAPPSLADYLKNPAGRGAHIFYIHGIGSDGPGDYDSWQLRRSICQYVKDCLQDAGTPAGPWQYADQDDFQIDAPAPALAYMGETVWKSQEEWRASAPYVVHFQLQRRHGPTIFVDELNWWPLIFSLKCRQIVATDARLVGPNRTRIATCSTRTPGDIDLRFRSYDWIPAQEAAGLLQLPSRGALINRSLKNGLLDWGFSDAVMALGPLRSYILEGLQQLILKSVPQGPDGSPAVPADVEYVIVAHSLGSYLIFSALNSTDSSSTSGQQSSNAFSQVLAHTPLVYFFANQLRLLELANLNPATSTNLVSRLEQWGNLRCQYLRSQANAPPTCLEPRIVALNDASDLLTWEIPENLKSVQVQNLRVRNYTVKNATRWFWLFENPTKAHDNYARKERAIRAIVSSPAP